MSNTKCSRVIPARVLFISAGCWHEFLLSELIRLFKIKLLNATITEDCSLK